MTCVNDTVEQALITPRYLADGGDARWITVPLHRAAGWSYGHDPLIPRVLLTSPDQLTELRLDPQPDDPAWWTSGTRAPQNTPAGRPPSRPAPPSRSSPRSPTP